MERKADARYGLQITAEPAFHRFEWIVKHFAWAVLAVLLLAAALGVFGGGGPLSSTRARTPDGALEIRYERFVRRSAPLQLEAHVAGTLADSGEVRLRVSQEYLAGARVEWITPLPLRVEAAGEDMIYVFAAHARAPSVLTFSLQMQRSGRRHARFMLGPNHWLSFTQFVYP